MIPWRMTDLDGVSVQECMHAEQRPSMSEMRFLSKNPGRIGKLLNKQTASTESCHCMPRVCRAQ